MNRMLIAKSAHAPWGWALIVVQWLAAITFLFFLYIGLYAGYNSTIPAIGQPSPRFLFVMRLMLGASLVGGVATSLVVMIWGTARQRIAAVLPAGLFLFVVYFILQQCVAVLWRKFA